MPFDAVKDRLARAAAFRTSARLQRTTIISLCRPLFTMQRKPANSPSAKRSSQLLQNLCLRSERQQSPA